MPAKGRGKNQLAQAAKLAKVENKEYFVYQTNADRKRIVTKRNCVVFTSYGRLLIPAPALDAMGITTHCNVAACVSEDMKTLSFFKVSSRSDSTLALKLITKTINGESQIFSPHIGEMHVKRFLKGNYLFERFMPGEPLEYVTDQAGTLYVTVPEGDYRERKFVEERENRARKTQKEGNLLLRSVKEEVLKIITGGSLD